MEENQAVPFCTQAVICGRREADAKSGFRRSKVSYIEQTLGLAADTMEEITE